MTLTVILFSVISLVALLSIFCIIIELFLRSALTGSLAIAIAQDPSRDPSRDHLWCIDSALFSHVTDADDDHVTGHVKDSKR